MRSRRRLQLQPVLLLLTVAVLTATVGCAPPRGSKPAVPRSGVLTGAWIHPRGSDRTGEQALWRRREADAGRRYDIAQTFYRFDKPFPSWREPWHLQQGRTPLITWGAVSTSQVNAGRHDAMIKARATSLRNLRGPVFLRWMAEMDGRAKASLAESPSRYVSAWRRIHGIFRRAGATNVAFVWCPNAWAWDIDNAVRWYPGDDVVDWTCADGYNWAPTRPGAKWDAFERIFANFYRWGAAKGKPMMIGEFGAIERRSGEKAAWILQMARTLRTRYPRVKAIVYFDERRAEQGLTFDWRLDSSRATYDTWNSVASHPYFNPFRR